MYILLWLFSVLKFSQEAGNKELGWLWDILKHLYKKKKVGKSPT